MNGYLKNLNKIEFVITDACTGRCKHCSEGEHKSVGERIKTEIAVDAVRRVSAEYKIETVMVFGGEPLLCVDAVCEIMNAAKQIGIPRRQIITNGYFSKNASEIRAVAKRLMECGVNDLLLSADAFHQETIPLEIVKTFASEVKACGAPIRLQPAWLVSKENVNPYNEKTVEILQSFRDLDICIGEGNVIFPEGNAKKFLSEYFTNEIVKNPYAEDPTDVRCLSFSASGDVLDGNAYQSDIMEIIDGYTA